MGNHVRRMLVAEDDGSPSFELVVYADGPLVHIVIPGDSCGAVAHGDIATLVARIRVQKPCPMSPDELSWFCAALEAAALEAAATQN